MPRVIFWDVDTQYDFMKADGKLYVPDAEQLIPNLRKLTDYAHGHGIAIIASADDHVVDHSEISTTPDWKETFPPHCLRGTPGQRKIPETALRDPLVIEPEPQDPAALAARVKSHRGDILFHKHRFDVFTNRNVLPVLRAESARHRALRRRPRRVRQVRHRRLAPAPPSGSALRRDGRDEAHRPRRRRAPPQGVGRGRRAAREDERSRDGRAGRRAGASDRMTSTASAPTHAVAVPSFGKFFLPGPTDVHPDVLEAMIRPMIGHRSSGMEKLLQNVAPKLGLLARTARPVFIGTNSATGFMEMAVRNGVRRRALSLVNGAFSERFAGIVGACGKECIRLDVPLGSAIEPDMLRDALKRTPVDAVTCVHSETSTGVLQHVAGYAEVIKEFDDVLLLVDAVTSMAGSPVETDRWGLDFVFTGSQKALALPPGLALGGASERMVARARTLEERGAYFDLISFLTATTKFQPTNTPAISLLYALEVQLGRIEHEGGIEARWQRHDAMRRRVEAWGAETGVKFLPREGR